MKKIILFFFIFISLCSYAQLPKYYSVTLSEDSLYSEQKRSFVLDFFLCENSEYEMRLTENTTSRGYYDENTGASIGHSEEIYYYISYGKYEINNDTLLLTDLYTHHKMVYKFDNSYAKIFGVDNVYIEPIKTFPFLINKIFTDWEQLYHIHYEVECDEMFDGIPIEIEERISDFIKEGTQENSLEKGQYSFGTWNIKLFDDEKYEVSLELNLFDSKLDLLLFIGTWKREENILMLWDTNLEHQFYGLILEDGIELLLFYIYNSAIFKKEK